MRFTWFSKCAIIVLCRLREHLLEVSLLSLLTLITRDTSQERVNNMTMTMSTNQYIKTQDMLQKKMKTLTYVRSSIENDMSKISTKSKEYKSMKDRVNNLYITGVKTNIKSFQLMLNLFLSAKKVSA